MLTPFRLAQAQINWTVGDLTGNTEKICQRIMTLPISATMNLVDADYVVGQIEESLKLKEAAI